MMNNYIEKGSATLFHQQGKPYTSISNEVINTITNPDALAIWTYLQSKSNNWEVIGTFLKKHFGIGQSRYSTAMKCLLDLGLIEYKLVRVDDGRLQGKRIIVKYELPTENPNLGKTELSENPNLGKTELSENKPLLNKRVITKEKSINEIKTPKDKKTVKHSLAGVRALAESYPVLNSIDDDLLDDWCTVRNATKAVFSKTALSAIEKRLATLQSEYNCAPAAALAVAVSKSWRGLEIDWIINELNLSKQYKPATTKNKELRQSEPELTLNEREQIAGDFMEQINELF